MLLSLQNQSKINKNHKKTTMKIQKATTNIRVLGIFLLAAVITVQAILPAPSARAEQILVRSLKLEAADTNPGGLNGGSRPSGAAPNVNSTANHTFLYTLPSVLSASVGSMLFEYCTTAADVGGATCVAPTGLNTTAATLGTTSGISSLQIQNISANSYRLTRAPGAAVVVAPNTVVGATVKGITNPSVLGTFYVRISTYTSLDNTGGAIDRGTVAASIADPIELSGVMPESRVCFCGGTGGGWGGGPDSAKTTQGIK
jgi:hypothetical protein